MQQNKNYIKNLTTKPTTIKLKKIFKKYKATTFWFKKLRKFYKSFK